MEAFFSAVRSIPYFSEKRVVYPPCENDMILGYHVDGLPAFSPDQIVELIDEAGYGSVVLPVGGRWFGPTRSGYQKCQEEIEVFAQSLQDRNLASIIEVAGRGTSRQDEAGEERDKGRVGGREFDSRGESLLIAADPQKRRNYLHLCEYAIDTAATFRSDCVVLRSGVWTYGTAGEEDPDAAWGRLTDSLNELLDYAEERAVPIGFEPSVGMLVDTTDAFNRLLGRIGSRMLRLSLDLSTLHFMGETPLAHFLHVWSGRLVNIYFCDVKDSMPNRRLRLGEGEIDFPPLFRALDETDYLGGVHVRFDGPPPGDGVETLRNSMRFLRRTARFQF